MSSSGKQHFKADIYGGPHNRMTIVDISCVDLDAAKAKSIKIAEALADDSSRYSITIKDDQDRILTEKKHSDSWYDWKIPSFSCNIKRLERLLDYNDFTHSSTEFAPYAAYVLIQHMKKFGVENIEDLEKMVAEEPEITRWLEQQKKVIVRDVKLDYDADYNAGYYDDYGYE